MEIRRADPIVHAIRLKKALDHKWQFPLKSSKASLATKAEIHKGIHSSILRLEHLEICGKDSS